MLKKLSLAVLFFLSTFAATVNPSDPDVVPAKIGRRGDEFFVITSERTVYFNNDTTKLCYTFSLPGEWEPAQQSGALRTRDHKRVVGVLFYSADSFDGIEGVDIITRAANHITREHEKTVGRPLKATLAPFEGGRHGAMIWEIPETVEWAGLQGKIPPKILASFPPGWVVVLTATASGATESERVSLARQMLETLSVIQNPQCYWPLIRQQFPDFKP